MSFEFDAASVELTDSCDFEPLPDGVYNVMVTKSQVKATKKGDGKNLEIEFTVINHPEFNGRKVFDRITFEHVDRNNNQKGRIVLKRFCVALGLGDYKIKSEQDFVGRTMKIEVCIEKNGIYENNHVVKRLPE